MIAERKFKIGTDVNTPVGVMRVMDYYWNDTSNNGVPHGCWAYYLAFLSNPTYLPSGNLYYVVLIKGFRRFYYSPRFYLIAALT